MNFYKHTNYNEIVVRTSTHIHKHKNANYLKYNPIIVYTQLGALVFVSPLNN